MKKNREEEISSISQDVLNYILARIPNFNEVWSNVQIKAPLEVLLGNTLDAFGDNPSAKSVIRDCIKLPGVYQNIANNNELGGTGLFYDESHAYAAIAKLGCKTTAILIGGWYTAWSDVSASARLANFVCEPVSRFLILAGKERQSLKDDSYFPSYVINHFKFKWVTESIVSSAPKVMISDTLGSFIGKAGVSKYVKTTIYNIVSPVSKKLFDGSFEHSSSLWDNIAENNEPHFSHINKASLFTAAFLPDLSAKIISDFVLTFFLATPSRIIQDGVGLITNHFYDMFSSEKHIKTIAVAQENESCEMTQHINSTYSEVDFMVSTKLSGMDVSYLLNGTPLSLGFES